MKFFKFFKDLLFTKNSKPEVSTPLVDKIVIEKNEVIDPSSGTIKINGNEQLQYKREIHFPSPEQNKGHEGQQGYQGYQKPTLSEKTKVEEPNPDLKSVSKNESLKKDKVNTEKTEKVVQDSTKSDKPKTKRKRPYKSKKPKQDPKQGE